MPATPGTEAGLGCRVDPVTLRPYAMYRSLRRAWRPRRRRRPRCGSAWQRARPRAHRCARCWPRRRRSAAAAVNPGAMRPITHCSSRWCRCGRQHGSAYRQGFWGLAACEALQQHVVQVQVQVAAWLSVPFRAVFF